MINPSYTRLPRRTPFRPAFALAGTIMLLFVLLILVLAVRSYFIWSSLPATPPRGISLYGHDEAAYVGMKIGIWVAPILGPFLVLGFAWLVGWLVSLMFGKSDDAGNIGAGVIMLGALALCGYGTYAVIAAQKNPPPQNVAAANPSPETPPGMVHPSSPREPVLGPPPSTSNPTPASPPPPSSRPAPAPSFQPPSSSFDAQPAIAEVQKPLDDAIAGVVAKADKLLPALSSRLPHEIRLVDQRLAAVEALRTAAQALDASLKSAQDDLKAKLVAAGAQQGEAMSLSLQWTSMTYKATPRQFGAEAILRLCDRAKEECQYLRENIAKWTIDSKGELKSKDAAFKSTADSNHFFVKAEADRKAHLLDQLQGR